MNALCERHQWRSTNHPPPRVCNEKAKRKVEHPKECPLSFIFHPLCVNTLCIVSPSRSLVITTLNVNSGTDDREEEVEENVQANAARNTVCGGTGQREKKLSGAPLALMSKRPESSAGRGCNHNYHSLS